MRKILAILVVISLCVFAFCGCTSKNEEGNTSTTQSTSESGENKETNNSETDENQSDAQTAKTDKTEKNSESNENQSNTKATKNSDVTKPAADKANMVIGKVVAVAGNQITIDVAEIDGDFEMPEMNFDDFSMPEGMTMPEGMEPPEDFEFDGEMPDFSGGSLFGGIFGGDFPSDGQLPEGMTMPDFANGEFPSGGQMPEFDMSDIELKYTGTKEKYIIPKGVKVGSGDYTSLSKGMVVGLQLDESGTVTSVMIISQ